MAKIDSTAFVQRVRQEVDQRLDNGEDASTSQIAAAAASSRFGDPYILARGREVATTLMARCQAMFFPDMVDAFEIGEGGGEESLSAWPDLLRLESAEYNSAPSPVPAKRFHAAGLTALTRPTSKPYSAERPAYVYDSPLDVRVYGVAATTGRPYNSADARFFGLVCPSSVDDIDQRFEKAMVLLVAAELLVTLGAIEDGLRAQGAGVAAIPGRIPIYVPTADGVETR